MSKFVERKVSVVDVLTSRLIVVSWQTSTAGRYGYQTWQKGVASRNGLCSLTGQSIRRGDTVFRPKGGTSQRPVNWDEMILAENVNDDVDPDRI
ncbi:DUF3331 domain-containing protein [Paraburkholderia sp. B3]|uniref:DUF3331 domain-containing protein n=1 Tax=Paraburkholderia sp. B3 TaxID=3134791 RepID=UPI003981D5C8